MNPVASIYQTKQERNHKSARKIIFFITLQQSLIHFSLPPGNQFSPIIISPSTLLFGASYHLHRLFQKP
jgi:hypothetical protein